MGLGGAIRRVRGITAEPKPATATPTEAPLTLVDLPDEPPGSPPALDLGSIFEAWTYQNGNSIETKKKRKRGIFHPSSALHEKTGLCKRLLMFELVFAPLSKGTIPTRLLKVMDAGTDRHVGLQGRFKKLAAQGFMGIIHVEEEVPCKHPWLPLSGHMDLLAVTNQGWRYAFDFKTWSEKNCATTFEPRWEHRVQLNTYMGIRGIRTGYMAYENKNNQNWLGPPNKFRINFSNQLFEETEHFCVEVLKLVAAEDMPAFDEKLCKDNILFCAYQGICGAEREGKAAWKDYDKRTDNTKKLHLKVVQ